MKTKNKSLFGLCCFLSIAFTACEAKGSSSVPSPYPVYDSGAWANWHAGSAQIYWIDNNRVLFKSVKDNDKKKISAGPFNLSIWEIGKGVKPYTAYVKGVGVCVNESIIKYTLEEESGKYRIFYGKFGEEKEITPSKLSYSDWIKSCRITDNPEIVAKHAQGRAVLSLLDRHGYLELGPIRGSESNENNSTVLYRSGHPKGITLPVRIGYVDYYVFKSVT